MNYNNYKIIHVIAWDGTIQFLVILMRLHYMDIQKKYVEYMYFIFHFFHMENA